MITTRVDQRAMPLVLPFLAGVMLLVLLLMLSIATGVVSIPIATILDAVAGRADAASSAIIRDLRAPRALLAACVGAGLASSGAALQGTLRNPLAEPYLLGVSGGAAVGAVVAMAFGLAAPLVTLAAFAGAALSTILVLSIARTVGGGADARLLLMSGVVVGAFANAAIMIALSDAPPDRVRGALWWMMGSTASANWGAVAWLALGLLVIGGVLVTYARELDLLVLGDEPAAALGVDVDRSARRAFLLASWLAASTVAAAGLIGFIGLVVPNLARALGARRHRSMLLMSAVYGAALLVGADLLARTLRPPSELPLGAVTAIVGVPFFLARLRRMR
jgi:iron complex transport system permease protein